ncbi:Equilibrative nucleotide transporter 3 [Linum perenne]
MSQVVGGGVATVDENPTRLEGKYKAVIVCWILGFGAIIAWNVMVTVADYYYSLFPSFDHGVPTLCSWDNGDMHMLRVEDEHEEAEHSRVLVDLLQHFDAPRYLATSGKGGIGPFVGICVVVAAFGISDVLVTGGVVGELSFMCPEFIQEDDVTPTRLSTKDLLIQNIDYALDLYLTYSLTLSIFPGFISENTGTHGMGTWYILLLIAMYNAWDLIGRYVPMVDTIKLKSRRWLMIANLARFAIVPAFYFMAKYGDKGWMIALTSFLGLTTGYLTVCVMTLAPKGYKGPEQNALGNLLVLFVLAGLFTGVMFDWLWLIGKKKSF